MRGIVKKATKRILSVTLCSAMVLSSLNYSSVIVKAEIDAEIVAKVADAEINLALNKTVTPYPEVVANEGLGLVAINNGAFGETGYQCALGKTGWGYSGESYAVIDLGDYYEASSIDQIIIQYKDAADNDTVFGKAYSIQYSVDGTDYTTIASTEVAELDADRCTTDDVSGATGAVRYVKVYYPQTATYGIQITEIAILSDNPVKATVETCADADSVSVSSDDYNSVTYTITAGAEQNADYRYNVILGSKEIASGVEAGKEYTVTGIEAGTYTLKVVSTYDGKVSAGITSDEVVVKDVSELITTVRNVATTVNNEEVSIIDVSSYYEDSYKGNESVALDSLTPSGEGTDAALRTGAGQEASFVIDLGANYKADEFDRILLAYSNPRTYASTTKVEFSKDNADYTVVGENSTYVCTKDNAGTADINAFKLDKISDYAETSVRYIRVSLSGGQNTWGYVINEVAVTVNTDNPTILDGVTVPEATDVTVESNKYNTIVTTITAVEGDYTYNIYIDGTKVESNVAAGTYTATDIDAGTHTVKVRTADANGNQSAGIEKSVEVKGAFTYTRGSVAGALADSSDNGNNYVRYQAVTASASSEGAVAANRHAGAAIDNDAGTRWESEASDPQEIIVDLGNVYNVKEIAMTWEAANAKTYTVQVSENGTDYTTVATVKNQGEGERLDTIVLTDMVSARYVKVNGTERNLTYGYSIYEIGIYGPDAEIKAPEYIDIVGIQMNTNVEGVAKEGPSFRVVSGVSSVLTGADGKSHTVTEYGVVYTLQSYLAEGDDNNIIVNDDNTNVKYHAVSSNLEGWTPSDAESDTNSYYALTFTKNGTNAAAMSAKYVLRAYAQLDDNTYVYSDPEVISIYDVAKDLYDNNKMSSATAHDYLYNNVLNVVSVMDNRTATIKSLIKALNIESASDPLYLDCAKVVYDKLFEFSSKGYVVGEGRSDRPDFGLDSNTEITDKLGMTLSEWMNSESGCYYTKKAFNNENTLVK